MSLFLSDTDIYHQLTFFCILVNPKEILKIYQIEHKIFPNYQDEWYVYHRDLSRYVSDHHICNMINNSWTYVTLKIYSLSDYKLSNPVHATCLNRTLNKRQCCINLSLNKIPIQTILVNLTCKNWTLRLFWTQKLLRRMRDLDSAILCW